MPNPKGRVVLITGATAGIGLSVAARLAKQGMTTVIVGRDRGRGQAAVEKIRNQSGSKPVELMIADLSSMKDLRRLAAEFSATHARLDVLINNVGGLYGKRWETAEGIEGTLALNHLGPFLLTHLLLPVLRASAPARIVNIASEGHKMVNTVDFDSFGPQQWKRGFQIYTQTKLCNVLFTYELAERLKHSGVTVNALHPGIVYTSLFRTFYTEKFNLFGKVVARAAELIAKQVAHRMLKFNTLEEAAVCPVYLASSNEVEGVTGKYFNSDTRMLESSPASHDQELSKRVWQVSTEMSGLLPHEQISPAGRSMQARG